MIVIGVICVIVGVILLIVALIELAAAPMDHQGAVLVPLSGLWLGTSMRLGLPGQRLEPFRG
jgi:hypothetical protein